MRTKPTIGLAAILVWVLAAGQQVPSSVAQAPAGDAAQTALTSQDETTLSRRILMVSVGANYDMLRDLLNGTLPMNENEVRGRFEAISAMLYAVPSLYRTAPNPYTEEANVADPARVSLSTEAVWEDFETFRSLMNEAYLKAKGLSEGDPAQFTAGFDELGIICETCHEGFRKPFETLDFDNPLGTGG